ncbi:MAG: class I SAM-dependent methyltransferase [Pseudomonadota bacterium]
MRPVSKTAWWAAGVRAEDARGAHPICGDAHAHLFLDEEGTRIWQDAAHLVRPAQSLLMRHALIDGLLARLLEADPATTVVLAGAGFDARPFRMAGGAWLEVDTPALISHKEDRLPASRCPRPLRRLGLDLLDPALEEQLRPLAGGPVVVVLEGVLIYLDDRELRSLLQVLGRALPGHRLICDVMTDLFMRRYAGELGDLFSRMGSPFRWRVAAPERVLVELGYGVEERRYLVEEAVARGLIRAPPWPIRKLFLRGLFDGSSLLQLRQVATAP